MFKLKKSYYKYLALLFIAIALLLLLKTNIDLEKIPLEELTFEQAAGLGEENVFNVLVWADQGAPDGFDRGDTVAVFPKDHQFSIAEKSGFIILKLSLSTKQTDLLTIPLSENEDGQTKEIRRRKFFIELDELGVADGQKGEINEVFDDWKNFVKKKKAK